MLMLESKWGLVWKREESFVKLIVVVKSLSWSCTLLFLLLSSCGWRDKPERWEIRCELSGWGVLGSRCMMIVSICSIVLMVVEFFYELFVVEGDFDTSALLCEVGFTQWSSMLTIQRNSLSMLYYSCLLFDLRYQLSTFVASVRVSNDDKSNDGYAIIIGKEEVVSRFKFVWTAHLFGALSAVNILYASCKVEQYVLRELYFRRERLRHEIRRRTL